MKADDVRRLRKLELKNARLKRMVAAQTLERRSRRFAKGDRGARRGGARRRSFSRTASSSRSDRLAGSPFRTARSSAASRSCQPVLRRCGRSCGGPPAADRGACGRAH